MGSSASVVLWLLSDIQFEGPYKGLPAKAYG